MRHSAFGIVLALLITSLLIFSFRIQPVKSATMIVPDNFLTIQEAINAASDGDTIFVRSGTYNENVIVNKSITLNGEDPTATILNGVDPSFWTGVLSLFSNSTCVNGFTITGGYFGIHLFDMISVGMISGNIISGNHVRNVTTGIYAYSLMNSTILANSIEANRWGIFLERSYNNTVFGNNITGSGAEYGIYCSAEINDYYVPGPGTGSNISKNEVRNSTYGIYLEPFIEFGDGYNVVENNLIEDNNYGIYVQGNRYNTIVGNTITNNSEDGVTLIGNPLGRQYGYYETEYVTLIGNNISNNGFGVRISGCLNNVVVGNNITQNTGGICLQPTYVPWFSDPPPFGDYYYSYNNTILENCVNMNTLYGIELTNSSDNSIYHNNLEQNTVRVSSENSTNLWHDGYPSGGNYWSDYNGTDTNGDGIGDTPYAIDANNADNYPLMSPYEYWSNPILGDVNKDTKVDMRDISFCCNAFCTIPGDSRWNPNCDLNEDDKVDMRDIGIACSNFGKHV